MKFLVLVIFLILSLSMNAMAQDNNTKSGDPEFSMKQYFFVFLNAVPDRPELDSAEAMDIQKGHLANISKMWEEGKCILAGPFMDNHNTRGILIMDVASKEEVEELLKNDPAITNGRLTAEIRPWYGPVGLTVIPD